LELNQNRYGTYLGGRELREEAVEGPVGLVLPESGHKSSRQ